MEKKIIENKEEMKINVEQMEHRMDGNMKINMDGMENNMYENKEEIQKSIKELQSSMSSMIFHALDDILPKGDIKM
jgi:hypothetical protein